MLPSLAILLWGIWPISQATRAVRVHLPDSSIIPDRSGGADIDRNLILTWPTRLRVGDRGLIQLSIEEAGASRVAHGEESGLQSNLQVLDENSIRSKASNILAEGRLEISGMIAVPAGEVYETIGEDGRAVFFWRARPGRAGIFDGFVWLHLNSVVPGESQGAESNMQSRVLLSAQRIQMVADDLFGLDGATARLLGTGGVVIACLLLFDTIFFKVLNRIGEENDKSHA